MALIDRIGPHTRRRLEQAAARRFAEADWLIEGKHHLTAIYLFGYVVEMIIGAAYCKNLGYGLIDPIDDRRLRTMLNSARQLSRAEDRSHPIDGLAQLLVNDKGALSPPSYSERMEKSIVEVASRICQYWGPKLRCRAIDATVRDVSTVRETALWFQRNSSSF